MHNSVDHESSDLSSAGERGLGALTVDRRARALAFARARSWHAPRWRGVDDYQMCKHRWQIVAIWYQKQPNQREKCLTYLDGKGWTILTSVARVANNLHEY